MSLPGLDFNSNRCICEPVKPPIAGPADEPRQTCFRSDHGAPAANDFKRCVARYGGERKVKHFSCLDQYLCMALAQLTWRESLRDIEACLRAHRTKLYHLGIRGNV